jgi:hypothetical protein
MLERIHYVVRVLAPLAVLAALALAAEAGQRWGSGHP